MLRNCTKSVFAVVTLAGISCIAMTSAQSQTLSYQFNFNKPDALTSFQASVPTFDETLGTLTGVQVQLNATATQNLHVFNSGGSTESFDSAQITSYVSATYFLGHTLTDNYTANFPGDTANPGFNTYPGSPSVMATDINEPSADFGSFETVGSGTKMFYAYGGNSTQLTNGGPDLGGSATTPINGNITVVYTYTTGSATPEPGMAALMAAGTLSGLALCRRRTR